MFLHADTFPLITAHLPLPALSRFFRTSKAIRARFQGVFDARVQRSLADTNRAAQDLVDYIARTYVGIHVHSVNNRPLLSHSADPTDRREWVLDLHTLSGRRLRAEFHAVPVYMGAITNIRLAFLRTDVHVVVDSALDGSLRWDNFGAVRRTYSRGLLVALQDANCLMEEG